MRFFTKWGYYLWSILELLWGVRNRRTLLGIFFSKPSQELKWLDLRASGLMVAVRSRMDVWSMKEALIDQFYERWGCPIEPDWTVVDIGAAIGEFTLIAALEASQGRVLAFEPNPGSVDILRQNLRANNINNVTVFHVGVWDKPGEIGLDLTQGEPLQAQSLQSAHNSNDIAIPVISLDELVRVQAEGHVDLLKLDCEGAEYAILMAAQADTLGQIDRIVLEYHELDEARSYRKLTPFLEKAGYTVTRHANPVHENIGYLFAKRVAC